jgi:hypothetical protein
MGLMAAQKIVTFRSQITGNISDLIEDEGLVCKPSQDFLCALAGEMLRYRDEGVELNPTVLFTTNAQRVIQTFPAAVRYVVADAEISANSAKKVLKGCAPLARGSWCIFIERTEGNRLQYGVFDYPSLPTTLPLADAITLDLDVFCVLVRKASPSTIEIIGAKGASLSMVFSTTRENSAIPHDPIGDFTRDCCSNIQAEATDQKDSAGQFPGYFRNLIANVLTDSHGTILLCTQSKEVLAEIDELKDGTLLDPKLDFFSVFSAYRQSESAESLRKLQSYEKLLSGLLMCDGTVVFDTSGSVIAYRVFYRPNTPSKSVGLSNGEGGARRRAFEGIRELVDKSLTSALFRSQDGLTLMARKNSK